MNKLSKSAIVLIILAIAAVVLGIVLFLNMPETWAESLGHGQWMERGAAYQYGFDRTAVGQSLRGRGFHGSHGGVFSLPLLLILAVILIFVFSGRGRRGFGRSNHARAILDQMYAEEKISVEEYRRKKVVIEEEN